MYNLICLVAQYVRVLYHKAQLRDLNWSTGAPFSIADTMLSLCEKFHKRENLLLHQVIYCWLSLLINVKPCYKRNGLATGWLFLLVTLTCLTETCQYKNVISMNGIAIQYKAMLYMKQSQKLVVLLVSVTIIWQPWICICMCIAILCLKEQNYVYEQSLYVE